VIFPAVVLPSDPRLRSMFGGDIRTHPRKRQPKKLVTPEARELRSYHSRLLRAERAGLLPPRVYLSRMRFAYVEVELLEKLSALPRRHARSLPLPQTAGTAKKRVAAKRKGRGLRKGSKA